MKKNELSITKDNIALTLKNDSLDRKSLLLKLIKMLNVIDTNYTISIDGRWGVGKSFFVNQLLYIHKNKEALNLFDDDNKNIIEEFSSKYVPIYYNAWENDNHDNVMESLIYNILNDYPNYKDVKIADSIFNQIKPILYKIIEKGTYGFLTKDYFENIKTFADLSNSIMTVEEKKKGLYEIINLLTSDNTRLLLIIDELDRCKPDYAVKVLETIKHFYNNDKVTCLVVTDNVQLSECVRHFYGYNFDGYGYLNKIYDNVLTLKNENLDNYLSKILNFPNNRYLSRIISYSLISYYDFSLRECNRFVSMYTLSYNYINYSKGFDQESYLPYSNIFLPLGLALKIKDINSFNKYINGTADNIVEEFINYITKDDKNGINTSWLLSIFKVEETKELNEVINNYYHKAVAKNDYGYDKYPLIEALSLLGNLIKYDEEITQ